MTDPVVTNTRTGRSHAVFVAAQGAKGTVAGSFSTRLWSRRTDIDFGRIKNIDGGRSMTTFAGDDISSRFSLPDLKEGMLILTATPEAADVLLRSNWGTPSGGIYALAQQVQTWYTLAWVEHTDASAAQQMVRIQDAFFDRLELVAADRGAAVIRAHYWGRASLVGANGGLPAMTHGDPAPADTNVFAMREAEFRRLSPSVNLRFGLLTVILDQRAVVGHAMTDGVKVIKGGKTLAAVELEGEVNDESWALLTSARAGTKETVRVKLFAPSPAKTLTLDLKNLDFDFDAGGHDGRSMRPFRATGHATVDSGGDFVAISLA